MSSFSVLMSVYKGDKPSYLRDALSSILNQSLAPDQIVIVKDGLLGYELDEVISDFEKKYSHITTLYNENNMGLGLSLQKGLMFCNYDYVFRMDADDLCEKTRFEKQMFFLKKGYDVVGTCYIAFEKNLTNKIAYRKLPEFDKEIKKQARYKSPICHASVGFRKRKVLEAGNYQHCEKYEDYHLWVRMMLIGCTFYNVQEPLFYMRTSLDQISRRGGFRYYLNELRVHKYFNSIGFIDKYQYFFNVFSRGLVRLSPKLIRRFIQYNIWKYS